ncbi:MAG: hypothetical protein NTV68_01650 [Methanomicrobiales archaeon]|nr:hypothetical protein [Methanomicrobiales archaeon]
MTHDEVKARIDEIEKIENTTISDSYLILETNLKHQKANNLINYYYYPPFFCPSSLHLSFVEPFIAAGKTMEDPLVFHPGPGLCRHEGKPFAAVVTHQGNANSWMHHGTTPMRPVPLHTRQGSGSFRSTPKPIVPRAERIFRPITSWSCTTAATDHPASHSCPNHNKRPAS